MANLCIITQFLCEKMRLRSIFQSVITGKKRRYVLTKPRAHNIIVTYIRVSGGTVLDIYDALYRYGKINHVLTSHEQGAAHAADGYARVTGKVGVCFATSGPGATNPARSLKRR